ncbi:MAG: hypothetical protein U0835_22590 [Isosphaeraceae bacterium]
MKWLKSFATLVLMGVPAWVVLAGVLQPGGSTLVVLVPEPGVEVEVDGRSVRADMDSRTFGPVEVDPGEHTVRVRNEGEVVYEKAARVVAGEAAEVRAAWKSGGDDGRTIPGLDLEGMQREGLEGRVTAVGQSGDGSTIVSVAADGSLRVWDARSAAEVGVIDAHTGAVRGLAVSHDGRRAVTIGDDQLLRVWDLPSGQVLKTVSTQPTRTWTCSAATHDAQFLAIGTADGKVAVIDVESGRVPQLVGRPLDSRRAGVLAGPGKTLAVGVVRPPRRGARQTSTKSRRAA